MEDEECPAIVADIGSAWCRVGFAGEDAPKSVFPTVVGKPKFEATTLMHQGVFIGDEGERFRDELDYNHPIEHGVVTDWTDMEHLWRHVYKELGVTPSGQPVLVAEPVFNPKTNRELMTQLLFETFDVPAIYLASSPILTSFSCGRGTCLAIESGADVTQITPVYEGRIITEAVERMDFAGRDITYNLAHMLQDAGYSFTTTAELEIVNDIKEKLCYVAVDFDKDTLTADITSDLQRSYTLPDGSVLALNNERFTAPEALFRPESFGRRWPAMQDFVNTSLMKCDIDTRRDLFVNIVLSGGNTMYSGFAERLNKELEAIIPRTMRVKVIAAPERKYHPWIGGSVLASLSTMSDMWLTKQDYEEIGPTAIHGRCY